MSSINLYWEHVSYRWLSSNACAVFLSYRRFPLFQTFPNMPHANLPKRQRPTDGVVVVIFDRNPVAATTAVSVLQRSPTLVQRWHSGPKGDDMYAASEGLTAMARAAVSCRHLFALNDEFTMRCFEIRRLRFAWGTFWSYRPSLLWPTRKSFPQPNPIDLYSAIS